jgi:hypothetical protein
MKIPALANHALLARVSRWAAGVGEFVGPRHRRIEPGDPAAAVGQALGDDMGNPLIAALQAAFHDSSCRVDDVVAD